MHTQTYTLHITFTNKLNISEDKTPEDIFINNPYSDTVFGPPNTIFGTSCQKV